MTEPSPERGVFRWAYHHAVRDRAKFWVGSLGLTAVIVVVATQIVPPTHPTAAQKIVNGLVVLAIAAGAIVAATYLYALVVAPFQQRNALRQELAAARAHVLELEKAPVSAQHADQLRQVAERVKRSIDRGEFPAYRTPGRDDQDLWRSAFFEHFPALRPLLEAVEGKQRPALLLHERLTREASAAGMDKPPWHPDEFIPIIANIIQARAVTGLLEGEFNFNWVQDGALVGLDDPTHGPTYLSLDDPTEDITGYTKCFEEFFREAERWPETRDLQPAAAASYLAAQELSRKLEVVMNSETITTRCPLCRLTS
ncbi:MAG TPA: hypothetical protein VFV73_43630 [Streptosporangiaceae bacterium]|nr:hypothetical protein [Streptosporangiaceae bacterium]